MLGGSGRHAGAKEKSTVDTLESSRWQVFSFPLMSIPDLRRRKEILRQICVRSPGSRALHIEDQIACRRYDRFVSPKNLSQEPLDAIANDRFADLSRNRHPEPVVGMVVFQNIQEKVPGRYFLASLIYPQELLPLPKPFFLR
jgi:hypothetical protein